MCNTVIAVFVNNFLIPDSGENVEQKTRKEKKVSLKATTDTSTAEQ